MGGEETAAQRDECTRKMVEGETKPPARGRRGRMDAAAGVAAAVAALFVD
jgi:hypothetical protein